jgi:hypothetical protein
VYVFEIEGHSKANICYAWSSLIEGNKRRGYHAVLHVPPIDSPEKALKAGVGLAITRDV